MRKLLLILPSALILVSCHHFHSKQVKGDGNVVKQTRTLGNFDGLEVSGALDVYVKQDSASPGVVVEVDQNLQSYIHTVNNNGVLEISQETNTSLSTTRGRVLIYVNTPALNELYASGACRVVSESQISSPGSLKITLSGSSDAGLDINSPAVMISGSGASTLTVKGKTKDLKMDGSGASKFRCYDLLSENANIDMSGASTAEVFASVKLDASASGASHIVYRGDAVITKDESGAGSVKKAD